MVVYGKDRLPLSSKIMRIFGTLTVFSIGFILLLYQKMITPSLMISTTIPIFVASLIPQIVGIYMNSSAGAISSTTVLIGFVNSWIRLFNNYWEINGIYSVFFVGAALGALLNSILFLQVMQIFYLFLSIVHLTHD